MFKPASNIVAALAVLSGIVFPLSAQTVRGVLKSQTSGMPVEAGFVILLDSDSVELQRTLVDENGGFVFGAARPGRYALRSQVIGLQSTTSPYFDLATGQVHEYEFKVPSVPVQLRALIVNDERVCRNRSETGLAATTLWNEAQKALNAVVWTEQQGMLRHQLERYERLLDPATLFVTDEGRSWTQEGLYRGSPFGSAPVRELVERGYIRDAGNNEWIYHGPDARVLLSDEFANSHCFSVRERRESEQGLLGLAFEPTSDRDKPDVAGVMWLDEETAELQFVEYRYTDPPWEIEASVAGGRIEFDRLPNGVWIVNRWWIRMPVVGLRPLQNVRLGRQPLDQYYLAAIRETGARVAEITPTEGQPSVGSEGAALIPADAYDSSNRGPPPVYRSGLQIGLLVNFLDTGSETAAFGRAPAFQASLRYTTGFGFQMTAAAQYSNHGIADVSHKYNLFQAFAEPRFTLPALMSGLTPFVGARLGRAWESVNDVGVSFKSRGLAYGGVGGFLVRLDNQISIETGVTFGSIGFDDFSATTDRRWDECVVEMGESGAPLPTTLVTCSPPEFWSGPQLTPGEGLTGTGEMPRVTYSDTARKDRWFGVWVGVVLRMWGRPVVDR